MGISESQMRSLSLVHCKAPNVLDAMVAHALSIGVKNGAATMSTYATDFPDLVFSATMINGSGTRMGVVGKDDVNYIGVVCAKNAKSLRTAEPSCDDGTDVIGEVPYCGNVVMQVKDVVAIIGYSGGSEDQDVEIAQVGVNVFEV